MGDVKYEISELAKKAREIFDTTPEAVTVALKTAGYSDATLSEAKAAVKAFLEKEVN